MTVGNSLKLIEHYKKLIENPDLAFFANSRIKPQGREVVIKHAKLHLADMENNLKMREYIKAHPDMKLNPATVLRKLSLPQEAIDKGVVELPKKEKTKKSK